IQAGGNLVFEYRPFSLDVTGPGDGAITLLAGIRRTSQDDDAFPVGSGALPLVYPGRVHQRIGIVNFATRSHACFVGAKLHASDFRFSRIQPPAIHALGEELIPQLSPVGPPPRRAEWIVPLTVARRE